MDSIIDENQLTIVKKYEIVKPLIYKIDCHDKYFHTNKYNCIYYKNLTNITNNEIFNLTISNKNWVCMIYLKN